jgi:hypothetical protein
MIMDETPEEAVQRQAAEQADRLAASNAARAADDAVATSFPPAYQAQAQARVNQQAGIDTSEGRQAAQQQYARHGFPAQPSVPTEMTGGGIAYRRAESQNADELMRGFEGEGRAREVAMYNLLRGVADTGYDYGAPIPPVATIEKTPESTPEQLLQQKQQAQLEAMRAQIMGMRAPSVGMNKYQIRGFEGQQGALGEQISAMNAGQPDIDAARAGMQQSGQQYMSGLERLNAQRQGVNDARRGVMSEDERRLAAEEKTFDASRVLRSLGDSPISTGVMSFAAGLVGALKGAAGDMSANQVLAEVDKSVERDVMNQKEQYSRMLQGQSTARTNFHDARQMGADDSEALAASAMASMDQHKRALQFAEQRVSGAREKSALKGAIYALDGQRGKLQMDLDLKNAAAQGSVNAAKIQAMMMLKAGGGGMSLDDGIKQGNAYREAVKDERWQASSMALQSIAEMRKLQAGIPLDKQAALWNTSVSRVMREAAGRAAASPDSGAAIAAAASYIGSQIKSGMSNDERKMLSFAQEMINNRLKAISGGSVTTGEQVRDLMSRNLDTFDGFNSWIDHSESNAMAGINSALAVGRFNPDLARVMEATVAPYIETNKQFAKSLADTASAAQKYAPKVPSDNTDADAGGYVQ